MVSLRFFLQSEVVQIWVCRCVLLAVILSEGRSPKSKDLLSVKEILRLRRVAAPLRMTVLY